MKKYLLSIVFIFIVSGASASEPLDYDLTNAVKGLQSKGKEDIVKTVSYFVGHATDVSSLYIFLASAKAIALNDVENAGFLYYVAKIRANIDLQVYPPLGGGDKGNP